MGPREDREDSQNVEDYSRGAAVLAGDGVEALDFLDVEGGVIGPEPMGGGFGEGGEESVVGGGDGEDGGVGEGWNGGCGVESGYHGSVQYVGQFAEREAVFRPGYSVAERNGMSGLHPL